MILSIVFRKFIIAVEHATNMKITGYYNTKSFRFTNGLSVREWLAGGKMKKHTVEEITEIYEKSGRLMYDATLSGDYKTNNREGKHLINIFKLFENDLDYGYQCIERLLESNNVVVKTEAASYCLALNYNVEYALSVLRDISNDPNNGIFGFNAGMILKVWKKNGYLKIY